MTRASLLSLLALSACASNKPAAPAPSEPVIVTRPMPGLEQKEATPMIDLKPIEAELVAKYGQAEAPRISRGLAQVAALWKPTDGDLAEFARAQFQPQGKPLDALLARLEAVLEQVDGHFLEIDRELQAPAQLEIGPLLPVDPLLASWDAAGHYTEDLFDTQIAFVALLNFPLTTLDERVRDGASYSRTQWAEVRLAGRFARRVPGEVARQIAQAGAAAELYIAQYNVWMHHLLDEQGERPFPKGLRLISHWNLRDELKADYADPKGLQKQRMIAQVMQRIVTQTIPAAVIDNPRVDWNPFTNEVKAAPEGEVEADAPAREAKADPAPEANVRYAKLLAQFRAAKAADPYSPTAPTAILRSFELQREIPEQRVKEILTTVLSSPLVGQVAAEIKARLGRPLEPHDIWFNGFQARGKIPEAQLDALCKKRYPTKEAFAKDIPRILTGLGFTPAKAKFVAEHIVVDASRGAGHAMQASRRGDFPHLRTRVEKDGMNYKGYNIAVHELGHNVEQVFSLYEVDHTLLQSVPNNAFTEALAFVFQARDLELLGLGKPDAEAERLRVLNDFWSTYEIAGVALVDVGVWHWMYEHPDATPAQLRDATVELAKQVWNQYYAPVLGGEGTPLLAVYSHMIANPLYLTDYPLGHLISFQIEDQFRKGKPLGAEFERMTTYGSVIPDLWMVNATGKPVGPEALLAATERALEAKK